MGREYFPLGISTIRPVVHPYGLRPDDSRNFKRPFAEKRPRMSNFFRVPCIWWVLLHLVGAFEHPWAPMVVQSAHGLYNSTLLVDKSAHEMQKILAHLFRVGSLPTFSVSVFPTKN